MRPSAGRPRAAGLSVRDRLRLLQSNTLFRELTPADLLPLALAADHVTFRAGETIVREGDAGDDIYFITAGRVQVGARREPAGIATQQPRLWLGAGNTVGELSMLDGQPHADSCVAVTATTCFRLRGVDFLAAIRDNWALGRALLATLARRVRRVDARLFDGGDPLAGLYGYGALTDHYAQTLRA